MAATDPEAAGDWGDTLVLVLEWNNEVVSYGRYWSPLLDARLASLNVDWIVSQPRPPHGRRLGTLPARATRA